MARKFFIFLCAFSIQFSFLNSTSSADHFLKDLRNESRQWLNLRLATEPISLDIIESDSIKEPSEMSLGLTRDSSCRFIERFGIRETHRLPHSIAPANRCEVFADIESDPNRYQLVIPNWAIEPLEVHHARHVSPAPSAILLSYFWSLPSIDITTRFEKGLKWAVSTSKSVAKTLDQASQLIPVKSLFDSITAMDFSHADFAIWQSEPRTEIIRPTSELDARAPLDYSNTMLITMDVATEYESVMNTVIGALEITEGTNDIYWQYYEDCDRWNVAFDQSNWKAILPWTSDVETEAEVSEDVETNIEVAAQPNLTGSIILVIRYLSGEVEALDRWSRSLELERIEFQLIETLQTIQFEN